MKSHARAGRALFAGALLVAGLLVTPARAQDPSGVYTLESGKLVVKMVMPSVLKANASIPNIKSMAQKTGLKGKLTFSPPSGQADNFELGLPPLPLIGSLALSGTWTADGTKFGVELIKEETLQQTIALLNELLGRTDLTATISKKSFIGKALPGDTVKAAFALAITVGLPPVSIVISLKGNLAGTYSGPVPTGAEAAAATAAARDFLTGFVVDEVRALAATAQ